LRIPSVWLHGHPIMVNVKFRNQIKILSDGYNIKNQTPKDKKQTEIQQDAAK